MEVFQLQSKSQLLTSSTRKMKIYDDEDDWVDEEDIL